MRERTTTPSGEAPGLLSLLGSLPFVSQTIQAISTWNIGPVTELLERAAYFPMSLDAGSRLGSAAFEVESELRRFELDADERAVRLLSRNRIGGPVADVRFRWRLVPDDYVGDPGRVQPLPLLPLRPGVAQRIEVLDWELRLRGGAGGYRGYGTGRTLPGAGVAGPAVGVAHVGVAFVLEVLEGYGQLAGLAGTVVACGTLSPTAALDLCVITRLMDPAGRLLTRAPLGPLPEAAGPEPGVTYLNFVGEVDPRNPVTLRISAGEGILGSNVYELLRMVDLDFVLDAAGRLRSRTVEGPLVGSVRAVLDFNPLTLRPITPIRTRAGVFELRNPAGRSLGTVASDMIEGRSLRTWLEGRLLPVFRFAGFGHIQGGTGDFAGASGILIMNSVISVQPRTLANLYTLRFNDPNGRYRAAAREAVSGGVGAGGVR